MNRKEWLRKLQLELYKLPRNEIDDAVAYYTEYFEEAGSEREKEVIETLGSPGKVATQIKADYAVRQLDAVDSKGENSKKTSSVKSAWWIVVAVIGGICAAPIALPLVITIVTFVVCIIIAIAGVILGLFGMAICLFVGSIVAVILGTITFGGSVPLAILLIGLGLMGLSFMAVFTYGLYRGCKAIIIKTAELIKKRHKKNLENKYGSAKTEKDNEGGEDNA